jgi:hypothetical protein
MNLKNLNESELKEFLANTNKLADVMQASRATNFSGDDTDNRSREPMLRDAERSAKDYARQRATGGAHPSRDAHLSPDERKIADETRAWIARQKKRGWWSRNSK